VVDNGEHMKSMNGLWLAGIVMRQLPGFAGGVGFSPREVFERSSVQNER